MSVVAKFYVQEVTNFAYGQGWAAPAPKVRVKLVVSTRGEENKAWASATPSGEINMTIGNPAAAEWFSSMIGKDVSISFNEAPDAVE